MYKKGTLDHIVVVIDGDEIVIHPYGEAWIQEGEGLPLHPIAMSIVWVALKGVLDETVPESSEEVLRRVLTALSIGLSYDHSVPEKHLQSVMDKLPSKAVVSKNSKGSKRVRPSRDTKGN